ncbi:MAG: hypothetical protein MUP69_11165 [Candidatus Atribacteria bacterium]|nr:hypothetical protein [Candidatus Atribacteria bacterium]
MKCYNKPILLFVMIFVFITMSIGCNGSNPIIPGIIDPNPTVNPDNSTVSYVIVSAASSTIKVGESVQIVVKGYNSDDEWVILDKSKVKSWDWSVIGQCYNCVVEFVDLSPKSGSLTTTFSSGVTGTFYIVAYYQENPGDKYITDYTEVKVTK